MREEIRHPAHYCMYPVESIDLARELPFCMGNVVKYILRAPWKGGTEDCDKALQYLEFEFESLQRGVPPKVFGIWRKDCERLCEYLLKAGGDALWQDISQATFNILREIGDYLATGQADTLLLLADNIRELRRILELRDREGDIYAGLVGRPGGSL